MLAVIDEQGGLERPMIRNFAFAARCAAAVGRLSGRALKSTLLGFYLSFLLAGPGATTDFIDPSVSDCAGAGCSSIIIRGMVVNRDGRPHPWTGSIYVAENECLFFEVVSPDLPAHGEEGLEVDLVTPGIDGAYFTDRDFTGQTFRFSPIFSGWWVVFVHSVDDKDQDFTLRYARYPKSRCP